MTDAQRAAAQRRAKEEESKDCAARMVDFVDNGPGALLVEDAPDSVVTSAPSWDDESAPTEAAPAVLVEAEAQPGEQIVRLGVTRADIDAKRAEYAAISFETKDGYEHGKKAIAHCRTTRTAVDDRRKQLNADSLAWQRRVNSEAKELIELIESVEKPLKEKKSAVDEIKEREKEEALRKKNEEIAAKLRAEREAEDAERKAKFEAEQAELQAERARLAADKAALDAERLRSEEAAKLANAEAEKRASEAQAARESALAFERAILDAERERISEAAAMAEADSKAAAEKARLEREAFETEKRAFQVQKEAAERAETERLAAIEAARLAAEKAEADRVAAELAAVAETERIAAEAARVEAIRPDVEKVHGLAKALRKFVASRAGSLNSAEANAAVLEALNAVSEAASKLEAFGVDLPQATAAE